LKPLASFSTINQFWSMYQHLKRPNVLEKETVLNLFVKGIKPMWEDPEHIVGGAWTFRAKRGHANQLWENLLLGFIGE
jgi:translation initiation factor 4E